MRVFLVTYEVSLPGSAQMNGTLFANVYQALEVPVKICINKGEFFYSCQPAPTTMKHES